MTKIDLRRWDQQLTSHETNYLVGLLAQWHSLQLSSEFEDRKKIIDAVQASDYLYLCRYALDYRSIRLQDALHLRQILAFFTKRDDLDVDAHPGRRAVEKYVEAERLCLQTNAIFRARSEGRFSFPSDVEQVLLSARGKIGFMLERGVPSFEELKFRFGPGATTQVKKKSASSRRKLAQKLACSEDLLPIVADILEEMPAWLDLQTSWTGKDEQEAVGSVLVELHDARPSLVRKTFETDRTIAVEPALNGMVQMALGDVLARVLKREGVDISDQTRNQKMAREGSLNGALATLDLSSASDCISYELVWDLLPVDWCELLCAARTSHIKLGKQRLMLQKFSTMGNGFTFALETLLFYALAVSCVDRHERHLVSVYGDDIIIPSTGYELLCRVLRCVGFIPNASKSYNDGPFRESCGKDFLSGTDIRPVYVKSALTGQDVFRLHNFYVRNLMEEPAAILLSHINPALRNWGPDGYGDGHLIGKWVPHRRSSHVSRGYGGYVFETYTWKPRREYSYALPGDHVLPSYSIYIRDPKGLGNVRRRYEGYLRDIALEYREMDLTGIGYVYRVGSSGRLELGVPTPGRLDSKLIKVYTLTGP